MGATGQPTDSGGSPIPVLSWSTVQALSFDDSPSVLSAAVAADVKVVRLVSTVNCYIKIGAGTPVAAAATSTFLPAGAVEYVEINGAGLEKIAVIAAAAEAGILNITECY